MAKEHLIRSNKTAVSSKNSLAGLEHSGVITPKADNKYSHSNILLVEFDVITVSIPWRCIQLNVARQINNETMKTEVTNVLSSNLMVLGQWLLRDWRLNNFLAERLLFFSFLLQFHFLHFLLDAFSHFI